MKKPAKPTKKVKKEVFNTPWCLRVDFSIMLSKEDQKALEKMDFEEIQDFFTARAGLEGSMFVTAKDGCNDMTDYNPDDDTESYLHPYDRDAEDDATENPRKSNTDDEAELKKKQNRQAGEGSNW